MTNRPGALGPQAKHFAVVVLLALVACDADLRAIGSERSTPATQAPEVWIHISRTGTHIVDGREPDEERVFRGQADLPPTPDDRSPRLHLRVEGDVLSERVATVLAEIPAFWETNLHTRSSDSAPIPISRGFECACMADEPARACIRPVVQLLPLETRVMLTSGWKGPCRVSKRKSTLYTLAPPGHTGRSLQVPPAPLADAASGDRAPGHPVIVPKPGGCATRATPAIDVEDLGRLLRRVTAKAPGCPYDSLEVAPGVPWSAVERALRASVHAGLSPHLSFAAQPISACDHVILEETLPPPATSVPLPPKSRDRYCSRTTVKK